MAHAANQTKKQITLADLSAPRGAADLAGGRDYFKEPGKVEYPSRA